MSCNTNISMLNNINVSLKNFDNIPEDMKKINNWVLWRKDKIKGKIPYQIDGTEARTNDPSTWKGYSDVQKLFETGKYDGIGFVITKETGIIGIDFDHCISDDGTILPDIEKYIKNINSYTEISPSGSGIHIFVRGVKPGQKSRKDNIEIYDSGRFLTITGNIFSSMKILNSSQNGINEIYSKIDPVQQPRQKIEETIKFDEILTDEEIISIMKKSKNHEKIKKLITNNLKYGSGKDCDYPSQSEADSSLCYHFAFYSKNPLQIDRLFRQTKLFRSKWDEMKGSKTYGQITILNAISHQKNTYSPTHEIDSLTVNGYNMTELGASYRFGKMYDGNILYCKAMKKWFIWDGTRFKIDTKNHIIENSKKMVEKMWSELKDIRDSRVQNEFFKFLKSLENGGKLDNIIDFASSSPNIAIEPEEIDPISSKIVLNNGVFDLDSMELLPFSDAKSEKFTKKMNVEYKSDAICPKWENHLKLIFDNDLELIEAFQIAMGYIFINENPDQVIFMAHGKGENGKSVTFSVISKILHDLQVRTNFETFAMKPVTDPRSDLAALSGVKLVVAAEAKDDVRNHNIMKVLDTELLKRISGGEPIRCRYLYAEWVYLQPNFSIWLMLNDLPTLNDTTHAMWRRLVLFPFDKRIPEEMKIQNYDKILYREENAGILNWMIEGYQKYKRHGKLKITDKMKKCIEEYRGDQDDILKFIQWFLERKSQNKVRTSELYTDYIGYCNSESVKPLGKKFFNREMANHDFKKITKDGYEFWEIRPETKQTFI